MVTFVKTGKRLIALADDPVARGLLYKMAKEDTEFSCLQLMELDNLHQVGHVPLLPASEGVALCGRVGLSSTAACAYRSARQKTRRQNDCAAVTWYRFKNVPQC